MLSSHRSAPGPRSQSRAIYVCEDSSGAFIMSPSRTSAGPLQSAGALCTCSSRPLQVNTAQLFDDVYGFRHRHDALAGRAPQCSTVARLALMVLTSSNAAAAVRPRARQAARHSAAQRGRLTCTDRTPCRGVAWRLQAGARYKRMSPDVTLCCYY